MDFSDLDTDPMTSTAPRALSSAAELQARAHIANGGEVAAHDCPRCSGSGVWRGNYRNFPCKACNGTGKTTAAKAAAAKGAKTKAANATKWREDHADVIAYMHRRAERGSNFYGKLLSDLEQWGTLKDYRVESIRKDMEGDEARLQEFRAKRDAEAATKSGDVGVERINALFAKAAEKLKAPIFRTEHLTIKPAKRQPGVLYVTDKRVDDPNGGKAGYVGKIVGGKFEARREAMADTLAILCEIAADPLESAVKYGRATGVCGCCGRALSDPASVAAGIGPVCAENWGL